MRIGIDATALPPQPVGAGNYIIHLIRALAAANYEYDLVVFAHPQGQESIGVPESERFRWRLIPGKSPARRLIWEQTMFPRLVRDSWLDLLHSLHYTRPLSLSCRSVVTLHDMTFFLFPRLHTWSKRHFFPLAIRASARRAQALIAISESTRQDAIRLLGIPTEKIFTTQLGVDPAFRPVLDPQARGEIRRKYQLPEKFILYVGLVEPRKNLPGLVEAYRSLLQQNIDCPLVIVGRFGWGYQQVLQQVESFGLKDRVYFTGYVPQQDLPIVYNLASLFVYPTFYEGFGLPVLEAMACGAPVVTTRVASLLEIVGDAGILVPAGDKQALSQAMSAVLTDPDLRNRLANAGTERASQFTWERTALQTLQVYKHALETTTRA